MTSATIKADPASAPFETPIASLPPAVRRVIAFIRANRATVLASSAVDIGELTQTSDATVVRAAQALGFSGLSDLKRALAASFDRAPTAADDMRRTLAEVGGSASAIDDVLEAHEDGMCMLRTSETRARIAAAVAILHRAERVALFGIGPSAPLAHYIAVLLGRAGRRTAVLDRTGRSLADQLLDLRAGDAILAMSYGRPYREIQATFAQARRLNLSKVLLTDDPNHALAGRAEALLVVPRGRAGRVALHGATLVALEALTLGLTAALGDKALASLDRLDALRDEIETRRGRG